MDLGAPDPSVVRSRRRGVLLMPYTLAMMLVWLVSAVALGIVTGWMLRNVTARRQISRSRSQRGDVAELERLRTRVTELEGIAAERDRLAAEFTARTGLGVTGTAAAIVSDETPAEAPGATSTVEPIVDPTAESPVIAGENADADSGTVAVAAVAVAEVDGREIVQDDLKAIEGIGPRVEELCHGIGIRAWTDLANTEVSLLRTMLDDAGARFKVHDPTTWPHQAELLAGGRWDEFAQFTASLHGDDDDTAT
jgi:predicted flap endonuclease-1-like 5' DNA nuclease